MILYTTERMKQKLIGIGGDASILNVEDGDWKGKEFVFLSWIF